MRSLTKNQMLMSLVLGLALSVASFGAVSASACADGGRVFQN